MIRNLKLRAATQDGPRTMVQQFGAGIEREVARNMVVSADAVGSFTSHLAVLRNLNQPLPRHARCQWRHSVSRISATSRRAK